VLTLTTLALMLPAQSAFAGPVVVGANVDVGDAGVNNVLVQTKCYKSYGLGSLCCS